MAHIRYQNHSHFLYANLNLLILQNLLGVGFEPTHPKILELESSALDRSAIQATLVFSSYRRKSL